MKENPFKRAIASHKQTTESVAEEIAPTKRIGTNARDIYCSDQQANLPTNSTQKRGRPATGKR